MCSATNQGKTAQLMTEMQTTHSCRTLTIKKADPTSALFAAKALCVELQVLLHLAQLLLQVGGLHARSLARRCLPSHTGNSFSSCSQRSGSKAGYCINSRGPFDEARSDCTAYHQQSSGCTGTSSGLFNQWKR